MENQKPLAVGDIIYACYGYDATFYNFYQVIGETAKSVKVRQVAVKKEYGNYSDYVSPIANEFVGDAITRRVKINGEGANNWIVKISDYIWSFNKWTGQESLGQSPVGTY